MKNKLIHIVIPLISFHLLHADIDLSGESSDFKYAFNRLYHSLATTKDDKSNNRIYKHSLKSVSSDGYEVILNDDMTLHVNWWYRSVPKNWKPGDQIFITFEDRQFKIEHANTHSVAWGSVVIPSQMPVIKKLPNDPGDPNYYSKVTLSNGFVFKCIEQKAFLNHEWAVNDSIIIFSNSSTAYQLWNYTKNTILPCVCIGSRHSKTDIKIIVDDILGLEERLNKKILQQPEATKAVSNSLLIYSAGLKKTKTPVGVFLFLGPTGVGKTELAKCLTEEIYHDFSHLLRFDMSHFNQAHSSERLIGSPPGYVNHEEGGQLTEPLLQDSRKVVLLDEIEKAHPEILKMFLPVFDEGYIFDSDNTKVDCSNSIFIMTSNLCGPQIMEMYRSGFTPEEILVAIEPELIETLSPELYNRVEPLLFRPLERETMNVLLDLKLAKVIKHIWEEKQIRVIIHESLREYLIENGYHPLLGARPLNKLVDKSITATLAYYIIKNEILDSCTLTIAYDTSTQSTLVTQSELE